MKVSVPPGFSSFVAGRRRQTVAAISPNLPKLYTGLPHKPASLDFPFMTKFRHLCAFESALACGAEWQIATGQWLILGVSRGIGYVRTQDAATEFSIGQVMVVPPRVRLEILASTLEQMQIKGIGIRLEALSGVISAGEHFRLEHKIALRSAPFKPAPEDHPFAEAFRESWHPQPRMSARDRLNLLMAFLEFVAPDIGSDQNGGTCPATTLKDRLHRFFNEVPETELMDLSPGRLARELNCCERHASRLFVEAFGRSIRDYVSELRLELACRLLTDSHRKIIDVAFESGHRSLAAFNLMFKRRFGITPSEWRHKDRQQTPMRRRTGHLKRLRTETALVC